MGHGGNVIEELTADHREVEEIFGRIQSTTDQGQKLRDLVDEVTIELVRHAVAEEQYLYPAVREHVEGGDGIADKEIRDHSRIEKLLKQLEKTKADSPEMSPLLQQLMEEVAEHVEDEENNLFPMLRQACSSQMLGDLGEKGPAGQSHGPDTSASCRPGHSACEQASRTGRRSGGPGS